MLMLFASPIIRIRSKHSIRLLRLALAKFLILSVARSLKIGGISQLLHGCIKSVQVTRLKNPLPCLSVLCWRLQTPATLLLIFFADREQRLLSLQHMGENLSPPMISFVHFIRPVAD